jgi:hypothetical protein
MLKNSEIIVKDMGSTAFTVYDYTPDQADLLRVYEFRTAAAVGREFHSRKAGELHRQLATLDAISTLTSSGAFVSLAFWKSAVGSTVLAVLVFIVALAGILRSSFRLSERADQHSRLMYAWTEMFLDLDQLLATARRSGAITEQVRIEMDFLCHRFQRVESMDNIRGAPKELKEIQASVESQLRPESQWLPPA